MKYLLPALLALTIWSACKDKNDDPAPSNPPCNCKEDYLYLGTVNHFVSVPTAFTPDGDGINDLFRAFRVDSAAIQPGSFLMTVTSGNDAILFQTNDPNNAWDGMTLGGMVVDPGKYYVSLRYNDYNGQLVDTCNCISLFRVNSQGCINTDSATYYFEDQMDWNTGQAVYTTHQQICP